MQIFPYVPITEPEPYEPLAKIFLEKLDLSSRTTDIIDNVSFEELLSTMVEMDSYLFEISELTDKVAAVCKKVGTNKFKLEMETVAFASSTGGVFYFGYRINGGSTVTMHTKGNGQGEGGNIPSIYAELELSYDDEIQIMVANLVNMNDFYLHGLSLRIEEIRQA